MFTNRLIRINRIKTVFGKFLLKCQNEILFLILNRIFLIFIFLDFNTIYILILLYSKKLFSINSLNTKSLSFIKLLSLHLTSVVSNNKSDRFFLICQTDLGIQSTKIFLLKQVF